MKRLAEITTDFMFYSYFGTLALLFVGVPLLLFVLDGLRVLGVA